MSVKIGLPWEHHVLSTITCPSKLLIDKFQVKSQSLAARFYLNIENIAKVINV